MYKHLLNSEVDYEPWILDLYKYLKSVSSGRVGKTIIGPERLKDVKARKLEVRYRIKGDYLFKQIGQ